MSDGPLTEPVTTDSDLTRRWLDVLSLGGGPGDPQARKLWLAFFDADDVQLPLLVPVDDAPEVLDPAMAQGLAEACTQVLGDQAVGGSVAVALERPGSPRVTVVDRAWERDLARAMADAGVHARRMHLAGTGWVLPLGRGSAFPLTYDPEPRSA